MASKITYRYTPSLRSIDDDGPLPFSGSFTIECAKAEGSETTLTFDNLSEDAKKRAAAGIVHALIEAKYSQSDCWRAATQIVSIEPVDSKQA